MPLIERELLTRARSPAGYWTRFAAGLAGILVCLPMLTGSGAITSAAQNGKTAFDGLIVVAFTLSCLSAFLTVDAISRERREGTLGLLFLTHVRPLDVLLGSFGAAGIASLCALAAFVPVLMLPILTGGVNGGEAARKVLVLFNTMTLSLAAGLWASARGRGWLSSARSATAVLIALIFGPVLLGALFHRYSHLSAVTWLSPLGSLKAADDSLYRKAAAPYWISIGIIHAISWMLIVHAAFRVRRASMEDDETPTISVKASRSHKPLTDDDAPLVWLMRRQQGVKTVVWMVAILYSSLPFFFVFGSRFQTWGVSFVRGINWSAYAVEGCVFAWAASRFFVEAKMSGEMELLLTTPEGASSLIASQWKWLKDVFIWPVIVLFGPWMLQCLYHNKYSTTTIAGSRIVYGHTSLFFMLFFCLTTVAGTAALLWTGMWFGWSQKTQSRAIAWTVIVAKAPPFIFGTLLTAILNTIVSRFGHHFSALISIEWHVTQVVLLIFYIWLIRWARDRLATKLPIEGASQPKRSFHPIYREIESAD